MHTVSKKVVVDHLFFFSFRTRSCSGRSSSGGHAELLTGAYLAHITNWTVTPYGPRRRGEGRGRKGSDTNYFENYFIFGRNFKKKMNWRISLAHSPAHM